MATSWSVDTERQDTAAPPVPSRGRGGAGGGYDRLPARAPARRTPRPRSSADRAPASGAGGAGSSPAGGALHFTYSDCLSGVPAASGPSFGNLCWQSASPRRYSSAARSGHAGTHAAARTIDLAPTRVRRKRQQRTKALHVQDVPWHEEGSGHRSGGVCHRGRQTKKWIIASGGDHGLADAQQMAELKEGSAVPRHNRPIPSCD